MTDDAVQLANLLYIYAERMDAGDLPGVAALFEHAEIETGDAVLRDSEAMLKLWRAYVKLHADGTPRTRHVISNPIIEIAPDRLTATVRSYYTVLQASDRIALQVIAAGRYHDAFEKVEGRWRFSRRNYSMLDLKGNLTDHLLMPSA